MTQGFVPDRRLEESAYRLLAKHEAKYGKIASPPVPIERILEDTLGLNILWDHITEPPGETILAGLNPEDHQVIFNETRRKLFDETSGLYYTVLGHESGHWDVHVDKTVLMHPRLAGFEKVYSCLYKKAGPGYGPKETQANRYMGYLLLPSNLVSSAAMGIDLTVWASLYKLREAFQVTISALKIRLEQLGLVYVASDGTLYPSRQEYAGQQRLSP